MISLNQEISLHTLLGEIEEWFDGDVFERTGDEMLYYVGDYLRNILDAKGEELT